MNDATEFGLAVDLAKSMLEERIKKTPPGDCCELLRTIIDGLSGIAHVNVCSVSFCENPDLLSQWRGYSGAGGVAIGFRSVDLKKLRGETGAALAIVSTIN